VVFNRFSETFHEPVQVVTPPSTDVHQHLWPPALVEALRSRRAPPRLRDWTLELAGEPAYAVEPADHDPAARAALARADGAERALVSLSSPLGIESLPATECGELLDAWHEGARTLPAPLQPWAAAGLADPDPEQLARRLTEGFVGLQLPATALSDEPAYVRLAPLLDVLERRSRPLFVHPGPAPAASVAGPPWWPALVDYVAQMHVAWFAFAAFGRSRHPRLRVLFAMLAGLGPLHGERFAARAGQRSVVDPDVFLDTSSYGPRAIDAVVRVTGVDTLVHGSDRPYAGPPDHGLGAAADVALRRTNPHRLLDPEEVSDAAVIAARP
jgi:predicted TIM-barrel fold metal-dependent hydrolase